MQQVTRTAFYQNIKITSDLTHILLGVGRMSIDISPEALGDAQEGVVFNDNIDQIQDTSVSEEVREEELAGDDESAGSDEMSVSGHGLSMPQAAVDVWTGHYDPLTLSKFLQNCHLYLTPPRYPNLVRTPAEIAYDRGETIAFSTIRHQYDHDAMEGAYGISYQWKLTYEEELSARNSNSSLLNAIEEPVQELIFEDVDLSRMKYVLQLREKEGDPWEDWLSLRCSEVCGGVWGYKVFAERDFPKDFIFAAFMGDRVWRAPAVGGPFLSLEDATDANVPDSDHAMALRGPDARSWVLLVCGHESFPLYNMGMHWVTRCEERDSNVQYISDATYVSKRILAKGEEMMSAVQNL